VTRYFLDNTAHIEKWTGDATRQEEVRDALGTETHATSSHSLREWRHIIEGTCVDFLNVLADARPRTWGEVLSRLSQGWGRTPGHRLRVMAMIAGGDTALDLDYMEMRAEALLRYEADIFFHDQIDVVRDGSECGLARNVVRRGPGGRREYVNPVTGSEWCKKSDTICVQDQDLGAKTKELESAALALLQSPDHKKMGEAALRAVKDPKQRKGKVCFTQLADTSITLECKPNEKILTTDRSFEVIAPALGLMVRRINPTPMP
jgi:hypothetical protein